MCHDVDLVLSLGAIKWVIPRISNSCKVVKKQFLKVIKEMKLSEPYVHIDCITTMGSDLNPSTSSHLTHKLTTKITVLAVYPQGAAV